MSFIDKLKTIKREYLILGGVGLALILILIFTNTNRQNYDLPDLDELELADITKIQVQKQSNVLLLEKENDKWLIHPKKYLADSEKVEKMIKLAAELKIDDLVSESKNYMLYELDEQNKVNVTLYKKEKVIRNFDIGKVSQTYNHTFVKLPGRSEVYHANGNFKNDFNITYNDLRDKKVLSFIKENINNVTLINAVGTKLKLKKETKVPEVQTETNKSAEPRKPEMKWMDSKGREIKMNLLNEILNTMNGLVCDSFIENKRKNDYKVPIYRVILNDAKEYTINIYKKTKDDKYPAVTSQRDYPFFLQSHSAEKIMKKFKDLKK